MEDTDYIAAVRYDPGTGEITGTRTGMLRDIENEEYPYVIGMGCTEAQYVDLDTMEIRDRPAMAVTQDKRSIAAGGTDAMTLSGLPVPCHVRIGTAGYGVTDGELEWSSLMPAVYEIEVTAFPYLDWRGEVEVV